MISSISGVWPHAVAAAIVNRRIFTCPPTEIRTGGGGRTQEIFGHRRLRNISQAFCFRTIHCILKDLGRSPIVKFCVLASGSSGNAALVATENTRLLIDAGLSMRELGKR